MTIDEMLMALEYGPINYGPDDDYIQVPVQTANKIAAALRAGQAMRDAHRTARQYDYYVAADAWDEATKESEEMTNKTERYFIVSEEELKCLQRAYEYNGPGVQYEREDAEVACRAREVRFIGAADQGSSLMLWGEVKK